MADEFLKVELRGLEPVPDGERHGHPRELFFIWAAALADFFSFLAGSILVSLLGLGVWDAIAVLVLGALAGGLLIGPLSVTGVRSGVPQIVFSRLAFGRRGAAVGGLLTTVIAIGWFSYDCAIAVITAKELPVFGSGPPPWAVALMLVAMVAGCILVAVYGHRTLTVFQTVQGPAFVVLCLVVAAVLAPRFNPGLSSSLAPWPHLAALLGGFTATFALIVSWATYAADYSRYLPRRSGALSVSLNAGLGSVVTLVFCGVLGVLIQTIDPTNLNIAEIIVKGLPAWLAWVFVAFIVIAEMSSNYLNVYTAALSALAIGIRLRRWTAALVVGGLGGAFAAFIVAQGAGFAQAYFSFLLVTYVWFPAWCVIVLIDFWRRPALPPAEDFVTGSSRLPAWNVAALVTFALGTVATLLFFLDPGVFEGPLAKGLFHDPPADISSIAGTLFSGLLFIALLRVTRRPAAGA